MSGVIVNRTDLLPGRNVRPEVVAFSLFAIGPGQDGGVAARRRDPSRPVAGAPDAAMMVSSSPQVAPRLGPSSRASSSAGPPPMATFLNTAPGRPGSKKPTHRPSGEMNGPFGRPERVSGCRLELVELVDEQLGAVDRAPPL